MHQCTRQSYSRKECTNSPKQQDIAAGQAIKAALDSNDLQEAWNLAKGWHQDATNAALRPFHCDFSELHKERSALYRAEPSPGEPTPVQLASPFDINNDPPTVGEVEDACQELHRKRAPGTSDIRTEDLQCWLGNCIKHQFGNMLAEPDPWQNVLEIMGTAFRTRELPKQLS